MCNLNKYRHSQDRKFCRYTSNYIRQTYYLIENKQNTVIQNPFVSGATKFANSPSGVVDFLCSMRFYSQMLCKIRTYIHYAKFHAETN